MLPGFATRHVCLSTLLLTTSGLALAQQANGTLEGELKGPELKTGYVVELFDLRSRTTVDRDPVDLNGEFSFLSVPKGSYEVRITDLYGNVLAHDFVRTNGGRDYVSIRLQTPVQARPAAGTVSLKRLARAEISKAAQKEFKKGAAAAQRNENEAAIEHFNRAIELSPDYMEAHTNLGARLILSGKPAEAVPHLEKAVALDPGCSVAFANLAIGYLQLDKLQDAERAARQAERLDPTSPKNRYVLGLTLANLGRSAEALRYLNAVAGEVPGARLVIAQLMADSGDRDGAAAVMRQYLAAAKGSERRRAEQWLQRLEAPQAETAGGVSP